MTNQIDKAAEIRQQQRDEWSVAAPGWRQHREVLTRPTAPMTDKMLEMAAIRPGQSVLDLACGIGEPAFSIARVVGPTGYVLGMDITKPMIEAAENWAEQHNLKNVEFRLITNELELGVGEASFDAATCRQGLMFMPMPVRVMETLRQALKPGGRVTVSTWCSLPFYNLLMQVLSGYVQIPPPDPTAPGPFAIASQEVLENILKAAGFSEVRSEMVRAGIIDKNDPAAYWDVASETSGPLMTLLAALPAEKRQDIRAETIHRLQDMFREGAVKLIGECLVAVGTNPLAS